MNIRKNIDYSGLYAGIDKALAANLPQMELYLELGGLVSSRPEKGTAIMTAGDITVNYPEWTGFSPRSLRRMREFYRMYEGHPKVLAQAMMIGRIQNIVIIEADLDMDARCWYLQATRQFGWSKAELAEQIAGNTHLEAVSEDVTAADGCMDAPEEVVTIENATLKIVVRAVDFLKELWYNWFWQLCLYQQGDTKGKAYG